MAAVAVMCSLPVIILEPPIYDIPQEFPSEGNSSKLGKIDQHSGATPLDALVKHTLLGPDSLALSSSRAGQRKSNNMDIGGGGSWMLGKLSEMMRRSRDINDPMAQDDSDDDTTGTASILASPPHFRSSDGSSGGFSERYF